MRKENEFIVWTGGECPVGEDVSVDVHLSSGGVVVNRSAGEFDWQRNGYGVDIIAYRVVDEKKPTVEIPEGFTPWSGGECPVPFGARVEVIFRAGLRNTGRTAALWHWAHAGGVSDIIAYRVVREEKPKDVIPEGFTPWTGGKCPVDTDAVVDVKLYGDGVVFNKKAGSLAWHGSAAIIAYRVVAQPAPSARDTQVAGTHYKDAAVQPWDVVDTWTVDQQVGFYRGNALKYIMRMGTKDENLREIRKAAHYLQKLGEVMEQKGGAGCVS